MSWQELLSLCIGIIGIILFLYGSNYYNAVAGWAGIALIFGALLTEIALKVYNGLKKERVG